jgi:hypothetical protein
LKDNNPDMEDGPLLDIIRVAISGNNYLFQDFHQGSRSA